MITNVVPKRGSRTRGLLEYLWGPGRSNEHVNPRIVGAWDSTFVRDAPLESFERGLLAREMEAPLRMFDRSLSDHVYHVSVSIHAEDGELTDEQWAEVANAAAVELGFTETDDHAAVPWIAMRHGKSEKGNDHIHFVATMCHEDGRVPEIHGDYAKWRTVRQHFANQWGLRTGRERGAGMPGLTQAELASGKRQGIDEPARIQLARAVRSAATGARTEAEFLRRVRQDGVLVRPRWEAGGHAHVEGYSVALKPEEGGKPVWFGGGKLADDLSLGELRKWWPESTPIQDADALREWRPPGWRDMPTGRQLERRAMRAEAWDEAGHRIADVRTALAGVEPTDAAVWGGVARESAGVLAALARRVEPTHRHQLSTASDALASAAQVSEAAPQPVRAEVLAPLAGVARAVSDAALVHHGGTIAIASVTMHIGRLVQQLEQAHQAAGRQAQAEQSARAAELMLEYVRRSPSPKQQMQIQREQQEREQREQEHRSHGERDWPASDRTRDDNTEGRDGR